jgi:hypothetical protein
MVHRALERGQVVDLLPKLIASVIGGHWTTLSTSTIAASCMLPVKPLHRTDDRLSRAGLVQGQGERSAHEPPER